MDSIDENIINERIYEIWLNTHWKFIIPFDIFKTLKLSELIKYNILNIDRKVNPNRIYKVDMEIQVESNEFEIFLIIKYFIDNLPKAFKLIYQKRNLIDLFKQQGKNNFMQYQFRYIYDKLPTLELKELFIFKRQFIREKILNILNIT